MDDWLVLVIALAVPVVTLGALGFILIMANKGVTVFERDASGNIVGIVTR